MYLFFCFLHWLPEQRVWKLSGIVYLCLTLIKSSNISFNKSDLCWYTWKTEKVWKELFEQRVIIYAHAQLCFCLYCLPQKGCLSLRLCFLSLDSSLDSLWTHFLFFSQHFAVAHCFSTVKFFNWINMAAICFTLQ